MSTEIGSIQGEFAEFIPLRGRWVLLAAGREERRYQRGQSDRQYLLVIFPT